MTVNGDEGIRLVTNFSGEPKLLTLVCCPPPLSPPPHPQPVFPLQDSEQLYDKVGVCDPVQDGD